MPAPIKVSFAVAGQDIVLSAFDTIEKRSKQLADKQVADATRSANLKAKAVKAGLDKEAKEAERVAKQKEREDAKAAASAVREADKASKQRQRILDRETKAQAKEQAAAAKEFAKAEREKTRAAEAESRRRDQINRQSAMMAGRIAAQQAKDEARTRGSWAKSAGGMGSRAVRATTGTVMGVVGTLGVAGGGMMIGDALRENIALREQAALLVNASRDKNGAATQTVEGLTSTSQKMAAKYGMSATDIMKSMSIVSARAGGGEGLEKYRKDMDDIIQTAKVFGVTMEDMGGVVAAALKADVSPGEEMRDLIQDIAAMGKEGSIEISDLAQELAKLGGAGKATELRSGAMLRRQTGLAQIAADAAVSPEESRTAVKDVIRDLNTANPALKAAGINLYGKTGLMKDPAQLIAQTIDVAMTKGLTIHGRHMVGSEALNKVFTGTSSAVVNSLLPEYNKGGAAGVLARIEGASGAHLAKGERDAGLATIMASPATQLAQNMEEFKAKMGEALPAFTALIPHITKAAQAFAGLATYIADNPIKGLGGLLALNVGKEVASAGIGKALETGIGALLNSQRGMAIGGIAIATATIIAGGIKLIDASHESGEKIGKDAYAAYASGTDASNRLKDFLKTEKSFETGESQGPTLQQLGAEGAIESKKATLGKLIKDATQAQSDTAASGGALAGALDSWDPIKRAAADANRGGTTADELSKMSKGLDELVTAAVKASNALNSISVPSLPNQSGVPVTKSPTSPLMK